MQISRTTHKIRFADLLFYTTTLLTSLKEVIIIIFVPR